jgi:hypothetical protein
MVEIDFAWTLAAGSFLRTSAGKKGAMQESHLHLSAVAGNGDWKEASILVVHVNEIDALIGSKGREAEPLPME